SMRMVLLCWLQFSALMACAQAQSVEDVVQDFRLIGAWAVDCRQPPAPRNEHATFSKASSGHIQLVNDFGADYDYMVYRIVEAERVDQDRVSLRQALTTDHLIVLDVVLWKVNDRIRIWSSRLADGKALVTNGTVVSASGQETAWAVRCNERWAGPPTE